VNLENLGRDDWVIGGVALLLVFDLLVFAWFSLPSASLTIGGTTLAFGGGSLTATDAPDGWLGILAVLALIALIVDLALDRLSPQTHVPVIGATRATSRFVLATVAAACMALKFLFHLGEFGNLGFGFWFGAALVGVLIYLTIQARQGNAVIAARSAGSSRSAGPRGTAGPPTA
jgi:hypothetical protein